MCRFDVIVADPSALAFVGASTEQQLMSFSDVNVMGNLAIRGDEDQQRNAMAIEGFYPKLYCRDSV